MTSKFKPQPRIAVKWGGLTAGFQTFFYVICTMDVMTIFLDVLRPFIIETFNKKSGKLLQTLQNKLFKIFWDFLYFFFKKKNNKSLFCTTPEPKHTIFFSVKRKTRALLYFTLWGQSQTIIRLTQKESFFFFSFLFSLKKSTCKTNLSMSLQE